MAKMHAEMLTAVALLACAIAAGGAECSAASGTYALRDGHACRTDGSRDRLLKDAPVAAAETEKGVWFWVQADSGICTEMKGSKSGFAFFRGDAGRTAGFLHLANARFCDIDFFPSGEKLPCFCDAGAGQELGLYLVDPKVKFVKTASFPSAGNVAWIYPRRFVLTLIGRGRGLRSDGPDSRRRSAALYDTAENKLAVLRQATATRDFACCGFDREKGTPLVAERSVKAAKDWSSLRKTAMKIVKIPIPAAG